MTRRLMALTLACLGVAHAAHADLRTEQKTKVQLAGVLGQMANILGGKGAREGVNTVVMVKGDRKVMLTGPTTQIIDLAEEKVYTIDNQKKTYTVVTFADMRRQMEEARRKAAEEASKSGAPSKPAPEATATQPEYDMDFDVKTTDETRVINGFNTHRAVMTVTVREKGTTLEQNGGLAVNTDLWLASRVPEMNELVDFDLRYAQKLFGPVIAGASPQDLAAAQAMYPLIRPALERMATEGKKLEGTPILTVITADAVKSAAQLAQEQQAAANDPKLSDSRSVGGLIGGLTKKATTKKEEPKARATFMTTTTEVLRISTDVSPNDVALPAGLKEVK